MMGHRSVYHDGWRAVCPWPGQSFTEAGAFFGAPINADKLTELDAKGWELYHVAEDWAENHDLAGTNRTKLIEMVGRWYVEAGKYYVLPIDSRGTTRFVDERPKISADRTQFTVYPNTQGIPTNAVPSILNRPYSITADVDMPAGGAEGVLFSLGANDGGFSLYVPDGRLRFAYNYVGRNVYYVESNVTVPAGRHRLRLEFEVTGKPEIANGKGAPGRGQLYIDEKLVGQGDIPLTNPLSIGLLAAFFCGADVGATVTPNYTSPFAFTGTIHKVTVDVSGEPIKDDEAAVRMIMARQ
jgi:arylsulfatase